MALDRGATIDLALVRSYDSLRLIEGGAVAALDGDLLEHRDDLLEPLREPAATTVDGRSYGLAYAWALDVLVSAPSIPTPSSLEVLLDPRYTGQVAMPDDVLHARDRGAAERRRGPVRALGEPSCRARRAVLQAQDGAARRALRRRRTGSRGCCGAGRWSRSPPPTTAATLAGEGLSVTTTLPREGTTGWFESWQLTSRTRHPVCAYRWLNLVTAPEAQAAIAHDGLGPASGEACDAARPRSLPAPGARDPRGRSGASASPARPIRPTAFGEWRRAWAVCCEP